MSVSREKHSHRELTHSIAELKEIAHNSSDVVAWYLHKYDTSKGGDATIRGPWNRWLTIFEGIDPKSHGNKDNCGVSDVQVDAEFVCVAMNNFIPLLDLITKMSEEINNIRVEQFFEGIHNE